VDTIKAIIKGKVDYVLPIKENQKLTYEDLRDYFKDKELLNKCIYKKVIEKEYNGVITREYYITSDINLMNKKEKWPSLKSI